MNRLHRIESLAALRRQVQAWRQAGERIAFVPTMGSLHAGHLKLCSRAAELADRVIVSIYVNPMQFGVNEDFGSYPRTLDADTQKLSSQAVDAVYLPTESIMYPDGLTTATRVRVPEVSQLWCGASRPDHFEGVTSIVARFLLQVQPDVAVFGEKDYQQLFIINKMVKDLFVPVEIVGVATERESDGLAMSSRNQYLTAAERAQATAIFQAMNQTEQMLVQGDRNYRALEEIAAKMLENNGFRRDYYAICRTSDLQPASDKAETEVVILAAAYLGKARLIDNRVISLRNGA